METHAGQAWVSLHLRLGDPPGPLHVVPSNPTRNSPARQRRRARREADRKQKAEEAKDVTEVVAGEAEEVSTNSVENAAKATEAESATIDEEAEVDEAGKVAEEATLDHFCDLCKRSFATFFRRV